MPYRRRKGSDTWHWCQNCKNWPEDNEDFEERSDKPTTGELDDECLSKESDGNCQR